MGTGEGRHPENAEDTARYIATLAHELRALAARSGLDFLAYLLAMVEDEAATAGDGAPPTPAARRVPR